MNLTVINSNSAGNAYILGNDKEALLIECGVRFDRIKQALNFDLSKVVGCIVTHEHLDHSESIHDVLKAGINVFATAGTHIARKSDKSHRAKVAKAGYQFEMGGFKIKAFDTKHDCAEPVGYLIHHADCGLVLFLTDSYYSEYTYKGLNNVIIEANYSQDIVDSRMSTGTTHKGLRDRVLESHMSLATCKETLQANDLSKVNNIVLIHLSDGNSDAKRFKQEVQQQTGKTVHIAEPGLVIPFNKHAF